MLTLIELQSLSFLSLSQVSHKLRTRIGIQGQEAPSFNLHNHDHDVLRYHVIGDETC